MVSLKTLLIGLALVSSTLHTATSRSTGAPREACTHLKPQHGAVEQEWRPGDINLTISKNNLNIDTYSPGEVYTVRISADRLGSGVFCKGFLVVARYKATGEQLNVVGAGFEGPSSSNSHYQLSDCYPPSSGVTHNTSDVKTSVDFNWRAPPAPAGAIEFRFTCVQQFDYYYVNIEGPTVNPDPAAPTDEPLVTHTPSIATTLPPTKGNSGSHVQMSCILMALLAVVTAAVL